MSLPLLPKPLRQSQFGAFGAGWASTNPSALRMDDGWLCLVKGVNWDFETVWRTGDYQARDPAERIACRYAIAHLDEAMREVARFDLDASAVIDLACKNAMIEDLRLFRAGEAMLVCGSLVERDFAWTGARWIAGAPDARMFVAELALDRLERPHVFASPTGARQEKNWAPLWRGDALALIVDVESGGRLACDPAGNWAIVECSPGSGPAWRGGWSGSSPFIAWDGGFLGIVHRKSTQPPYRYAHMLVWLDSGLNPRRRSAPFSFEGAPVEFCCGLDADGDAVTIAWGVMDRSATVAEFARADITPLLTEETESAGNAHIFWPSAP